MAKFTLDDFLNEDDDELELQDEITLEPKVSKPIAEHRSGYVALIGRPNAGKSTLMNALVGSRLSIVTHKAQTTRNRVIGILSDEDSQIIFLDTPGIIEPKYKLQEVMMGYVTKSVDDADLVLLLVDAGNKKKEYQLFLDRLKNVQKKVILIVNKIDLATQEEVNTLIEELKSEFRFKDIIAISALTQTGVLELRNQLKAWMKPEPPFYPKEMLSEHPERFFVTELIREQLFLQYEQEIPYSCAVDILQYKETEEIDYIDADIIVERESQKGILIGKKGLKLKQLGMASRKEIELFIGKRIHLKLFVKVREKWREKDHFLRGLGYSKD